METHNYLIYKIVCKDASVTEMYIGSSKDIKKRTRQHKSDCHNELRPNYNCKIYQIIRANGGWANWDLIVLEELPNVTKEQAIMREEYWRIELQATLNTYRSHRTLEQQKDYHKLRYEINKIQIREQHKRYYENNKERINEQRKEYQKQYREKNRALKKLLAGTHPPLDEKI